jgi:hypothetical protein
VPAHPGELAVLLRDRTSLHADLPAVVDPPRASGTSPDYW